MSSRGRALFGQRCTPSKIRKRVCALDLIIRAASAFTPIILPMSTRRLPRKKNSTTTNCWRWRSSLTSPGVGRSTFRSRHRPGHRHSAHGRTTNGISHHQPGKSPPAHYRFCKKALKSPSRLSCRFPPMTQAKPKENSMSKRRLGS